MIVSNYIKCSLLLCCILSVIDFNTATDNSIKSSSNNKDTTFSDKVRQNIRLSGRCVKGCGFGYENNNKNDNNNNKSNSKYKDVTNFNNLIKSKNMFMTEFKRNRIDDDFDSMFAYCKSSNKTFESCMGIAKESLLFEQASECYTACMEKAEIENAGATTAAAIDFDSGAYAQQHLELCLDNYTKQEKLSFDYNELLQSSGTTTTKNEKQNNNILENMIESYKSNGYLIVENVFPNNTNKLKDITNILNAWRKIGTWDTLNFTSHSFDEYLLTNANRFEVMIPYKEPFMSLVSTIKSLDIVKELIYDKNGKLDIVSSSASLPGAIKQKSYRTNIEKDMDIMVNIIPHDMTIANGPMVLCPCTHHYVRLLNTYPLIDTCPIQSNSFEYKAGTLVIYDGALLRYDNKNYGNIVKWNVEISYNMDADEKTLAMPMVGSDGDVVKHVEEYRKIM